MTIKSDPRLFSAKKKKRLGDYFCQLQFPSRKLLNAKADRSREKGEMMETLQTITLCCYSENLNAKEKQLAENSKGICHLFGTENKFSSL